MTEPDQVEFHERVVAGTRQNATHSLPVRAGIVAGSAVLLVVGAVAAMGAGAPSSNGGLGAELSAAVEPIAGSDSPTLDGGPGMRGFGHGRFGQIEITAVNGSSLSLETEDGWTRTITVGSDTEITKAGETAALADLAVGDLIAFAQERQDDGTFTITAIKVVLPTLGGEVTAISGNTITVTGKDDVTSTIHVDGDTTYQENGDAAALSDIEVGDFVVAEGALRDDGSLDADVVRSGNHGFRDGSGPGRGFHGDRDADPNATPTPTPSTSSSVS